jgi:hypothetical protein
VPVRPRSAGRKRPDRSWWSGALAGDPVPVVYGSQVEIYGRGTDGTTIAAAWTPRTGWSGWQNFGGNLVP